mgnify:CR=1 FL=1
MLTLYGTSWCSDCKRAKQLLGEQRVPYEFVDIDSDEAGLAYVQEVNEGKATTDQYFVLQNLCTRIDELVAAKGA